MALDELPELHQIFHQISMASRASAGSRSDSPVDQSAVATDFSEPLLATTSGAGGLIQAFDHGAGTSSVVTSMREALDELRGCLQFFNMCIIKVFVQLSRLLVSVGRNYLPSIRKKSSAEQD